jgi:tetratricopeptide (TPR) repeat protein
MKNTIIFLLLMAFMPSISYGTGNYNNKGNQTNFELNNIQTKILNAFVNSVKTRNAKELNSIESSLLRDISKNKNQLNEYWYSFNCYYHSIMLMETNDLQGSEKILKSGINKLEKVEKKNSEDYSLLALMECLSMKFAKEKDFQTIAYNIETNLSKAVQLDSTNLRAYYVLAAYDFYKPEQFGGGKKAENFLKKAITLKDRNVNKPYIPSWGKNLCYEMLIRLYLNEGKKAEAKMIFNAAISLFPSDYQISKVGEELKNL